MLEVGGKGKVQSRKKMNQNIETFLEGKRGKIKSLKRQPIIINWLKSFSMQKKLELIDKKVNYLLQNSHIGGKSKLSDWFLSGDENFVNITAERYIIEYLMSNNNFIRDNLKGKGPDALLETGQDEVGIEVTTLNGFIVDWIFTERLSEQLLLKGAILNKTIRIDYNHKKLKNNKHKIYEYIDHVASAIDTYDRTTLNDSEISVEYEYRWPGSISWNHDSADNFPWFNYLTTELSSKLCKRRKSEQLKQFQKNLVFVGVNQIAPHNWAIPMIFNEIGKGGNSYIEAINGIDNFWSRELQDLPHITGICYFCYSLDREEPFYPLRVFWRNEAERIAITL